MATAASTAGVVSSWTLQFVNRATNNFSDAQKIGEGAFGTVYVGTVDGKKIAVKKLKESSLVTREKQFKNEVDSLMKIEHENIVKLLAFCQETQKELLMRNGKHCFDHITHTILCYEYLPMGSLDKYIFASHNMPWNERFIIIKGICKGLHFLHNLERPIIHMDLKPDNILLDEYMLPKIADFGLSRIFGEGQTRAITLHKVGAMGYMAPEYAYNGEISTRSDIYSLGLLIIEITTGEKNFSFGTRDDVCALKFISAVRQRWTEEYTSSKYPSDCIEELKTCISIGLRCVEHDRNRRPSMEAIVNELNGVCAG